MTRYVGEPSQERKAVQGRWGVEDLRRRPAPVIPTNAVYPPYPYIYRIMTTDNSIPADSAGEAITWDTTDTTQAAGFFSSASAQLTRITSQGAGSKGRYSFNVGVRWAPAFNAGVGIAINSGAFGWFPSSYWKAPYGASGLERGDIAHVFHFDARLDTASLIDFNVDVYHEHASAQSVIDVVLEVGYLGPWLGSAVGTYWF